MMLLVNPGGGNERFSDACLLNSGYTYHMCPKKEWYSIYELFEGGIILMGNNVACKTVGIGSLHMKMLDE